jgi:hypothetical protein
MWSYYGCIFLKMYSYVEVLEKKSVEEVIENFSNVVFMRVTKMY